MTKTRPLALLSLVVSLALLPDLVATGAGSISARSQSPDLVASAPDRARVTKALQSAPVALIESIDQSGLVVTGHTLAVHGERAGLRDSRYGAAVPLAPISTGLTDTLAGSHSWSTPLSAVEEITVTRWVDPEGRQPITYDEWKGELPLHGPFTIRKEVEREVRLAPHQAAPKVCVIVNSTLYGSIRASVDQYANDLAAEGYMVVVHSTSGGVPSDLRAFLQGELPGNLVGCLLVGDLPVPWYEMDNDFSGYAEFPIDLYYMDLDGQWTDADGDERFDDHIDGAGDIGPEIWVGRLTASPLSGDEVARVQGYFSKNHRYRTGDLNLAHRALTYIYDDWSYFGKSDLSRSQKVCHTFAGGCVPIN